MVAASATVFTVTSRVSELEAELLPSLAVVADIAPGSNNKIDDFRAQIRASGARLSRYWRQLQAGLANQYAGSVQQIRHVKYGLLIALHIGRELAHERGGNVGIDLAIQENRPLGVRQLGCGSC